jgi:hypothetical protein
LRTPPRDLERDLPIGSFAGATISPDNSRRRAADVNASLTLCDFSITQPTISCRQTLIVTVKK